MARNIEIKARTSSIASLAMQVGLLSQAEPVLIAQDDTFFECQSGRLKLRAFEDGTGQLIFYRRSDQAGPKESFYLMSETDNPDALRDVLATAYGEIGRVKKTRKLFILGRTRVHLDTVEALGEFMELEVVLDDDEQSEAGVEEAMTLMLKLGIQPSALIEGAYLDLLQASR